MPTTSPKQYGFFQAILHGKAKKPGPSKDVAREFIDATPSPAKSKFAKALRKKR